MDTRNDVFQIQEVCKVALELKKIFISWPGYLSLNNLGKDRGLWVKLAIYLICEYVW